MIGNEKGLLSVLIIYYQLSINTQTFNKRYHSLYVETAQPHGSSSLIGNIGLEEVGDEGGISDAKYSSKSRWIKI